MGKIVLIGGGEIKDYETFSFDKRIVQLTGKSNPKALFIPTASGEAEGYIDTFQKVYGEDLGCETDILYLLNEKPSIEKLREKILSSDLIYVGGGNTLKMMRRWRLLGVDKILKEAYDKGIVLSGISAGGICWFEAGHSDSNSFYAVDDNREYIKVRGLGLLKGIHCPHFDGEHRKENFQSFMKKHGGVGIAIDNHCAIEFVDGNFKVLTGIEEGRAYKVMKQKGEIVTEEIPKFQKYIPETFLYKKQF